MERNQFVDISKGIGIILVVFGHSNLPELINKFIYLFHMPFFFFVSGMFFKPQNEFFKGIIKKLKTLIVPYLFFTILNILLFSLFSNKYSFESIFKNGWSGIALWFVPILFFVYFTTIIFFKNNLKWLIINYLICFFCIFIFQKESLFFFYKFEIIPICYFWFLVGYTFQLFKSKINFLIKNPYYLVLLFIITFVLSYFNPSKIDLALNKFSFYHFALIGGISGILMIFNFSFIIYNSKIEILKQILKYCGENTFVILALHQVYIFSLNHLFSALKLNTPLNFLFKYAFLVILLFISIFIMNKYLYFILGKRIENRYSN